MRIELRGLSHRQPAAPRPARLGVTDGVARCARDLVPRVAGNPFFLLEMVDALLERGTLEIQGRARRTGARSCASRAAGATAQSLPSTLEQLIADRLNELPPEEHGIVDWLAVAGGPLAVAELDRAGRARGARRP